ncbi:MAG: biopolymer transporter ExbD [Candidatus Binatia bacterium]
MDILDDSNLRSAHYQPVSPLLSEEDDIGEVLPPSKLRRSGRRRWQEPVLNITSFVDVLSVLLFFLLSVATLERLGAHDVTLPKQTQSFTQDSPFEVKNLSLSLARDGLKLRALVTAAGKEPEALGLELGVRDGGYDLAALQEELLRIKGAYKTDDAIIMMVADDVHFDWVVKVMDTVREKIVFENGARQITRLFPQVSLSDYLIESQA